MFLAAVDQRSQRLIVALPGRGGGPEPIREETRVLAAGAPTLFTQGGSHTSSASCLVQIPVDCSAATPNTGSASRRTPRGRPSPPRSSRTLGTREPLTPGRIPAAGDPLALGWPVCRGITPLRTAGRADVPGFSRESRSSVPPRLGRHRGGTAPWPLCGRSLAASRRRPLPSRLFID